MFCLSNPPGGLAVAGFRHGGGGIAAGACLLQKGLASIYRYLLFYKMFSNSSINRFCNSTNTIILQLELSISLFISLRCYYSTPLLSTSSCYYLAEIVVGLAGSCTSSCSPLQYAAIAEGHSTGLFLRANEESSLKCLSLFPLDVFSACSTKRTEPF